MSLFVKIILGGLVVVFAVPSYFAVLWLIEIYRHVTRS